MKKFNVLNFIIRMLKVGAFLTVGFTILLVVVAFFGMIDSWNRYGSSYSTAWNFWSNQMLALGMGTTFGLVAALLIYGVAELLDLLISIQENTYSTANVLRNMYRDQLNAGTAVHISTQGQSHNNGSQRLYDVMDEGTPVMPDEEMPMQQRRK